MLSTKQIKTPFQKPFIKKTTYDHLAPHNYSCLKTFIHSILHNLYGYERDLSLKWVVDLEGYECNMILVAELDFEITCIQATYIKNLLETYPFYESSWFATNHGTISKKLGQSIEVPYIGTLFLPNHTPGSDEYLKLFDQYSFL